jgi:hypothetical protein
MGTISRAHNCARKGYAWCDSFSTWLKFFSVWTEEIEEFFKEKCQFLSRLDGFYEIVLTVFKLT